MIRSAYRLTCVYTRAAVGEFTAMVFFPLVLLGLYGIYTSDRPRFGDWLPMAGGALIQQRLYEKQSFFTLAHGQNLFSMTCLGQVSAQRPQWRQWCWSMTTGFLVMSMHFCGQME